MKKSKLKIMLLFTAALLVSATDVCGGNLQKKLKNAPGVKVTYQNIYKGKPAGSNMIMTLCNNEELLESADTVSEGDLKTTSYIDYNTRNAYRMATLPNGKVVSSVTPFEFGKGMTEVGTGKVLGLECKIMRTSINSNTIEIWYTTQLPFKGTPQAGVGVPDGLVLKVVRNGDRIQEAVSMVALKKAVKLLPASWGEVMDASDLQYAINQSGVITVPVFDQQAVCFNGAKLPESLKDGEMYQAGGGTIILKKVKLPENVKDRQVFVELAQYSDGDAYDRTGSLFMIPVDKKLSFLDAMRNLNEMPSFKANDGNEYHGLVSDNEYNVPVELMRFFTGFGVRKFNGNKVPGQDWVDSVLYKSDVTQLADRLKGEAWIGAYIGNWDAKGHKVSVRLKYYPSESERVYRTMPLFNTVNYLEQGGQQYPLFMRGDSLTAKFTLKEPVKDAKLLYFTTGHGGWGNGDEFNQKPNTIMLDGQKVITFVPWRDDCGTYRNLNPCSGNFSNGLSSSDLSRSNWCPGTVTTPEYIYLGDMEAGEHTITVAIPQGAPEGGSNSYWCISGTLLY